MISLLSIIVSSLVAFALGAIWYLPNVFGTVWAKGAKLKKSEIKPRPFAMLIGLALIVILSVALQGILDFVGVQTLTSSVLVGIFLWAAFVATIMMSGLLWEKKPLSYFVINTSYYLVVFVMISALYVVL